MRIVKKKSPVSDQDKTLLQNIVNGAADDSITFDQIRAAVSPDVKARFTDGYIHQVAIELNLTVENNDTAPRAAVIDITFT